LSVLTCLASFFSWRDQSVVFPLNNEHAVAAPLIKHLERMCQ